MQVTDLLKPRTIEIEPLSEHRGREGPPARVHADRGRVDERDAGEDDPRARPARSGGFLPTRHRRNTALELAWALDRG